MKKVLKLFFIAVCFIIASNLFNPVSSKANNESNLNVSVNTASEQNLFIYLRIVENGRVFIYIYTDGGIFVTKIEEL